MPETPSEISSTGTLQTVASALPNRLLLTWGTKIACIDIWDKHENEKSVSVFLSKIDNKRKQVKQHWNLFGYLSEFQ